MNQLKNKAMLVNLTIKQWSAAKHDRKISREVAQTHNSQESMGRFNKQLLPPKALENVKKIAGAWRTAHYQLTLPWMDNGSRILSSDGYFKYSQLMAKYEAEYIAAADAAAAEYPNHRADAQRLLNGLFDATEYPETAEFRKRFSGGVNYFPLPDVADMRYDIGDAELDRIKQETQDSLNAALDLAMADVWTRIKTVVSAMAERLRAYKVTAEGTEGIFRDSLVQNVRELVDILPMLNITSNPDIADFTDIMRRTLCKHDAEQLRNSELTRDEVAKAAETILAQMEDFI